MLVIQRPTVEEVGEESNNRQRFAVGPLDPGFGHTLGNSLRRTLLSSIPGAAITTVQLHCYTFVDTRNNKTYGKNIVVPIIIPAKSEKRAMQLIIQG